MCKKCIIVYWSFWWGRGLIGRQWCIHVKRGGGGDWDRPGGQKEVFCVSVTAHSSPSQALQPRVTVSFFGQFALKLWNVFALWDQPGMRVGSGTCIQAAAALTRLKGSLQEGWRVIDEEKHPLPLSSCSAPCFPFSNQMFPTFLFVFTYRVWFVASIWLWIVTPWRGAFLLSCFSGGDLVALKGLRFLCVHENQHRLFLSLAWETIHK